MNSILVDSNVLLDLFLNDPNWVDWSEDVLHRYSNQGTLYINPIIYSEISIGFQKIEELEEVIKTCNLKMKQIPREALLLAGKAFLKYRKKRGKKSSPLPDFFIGAHAAVESMILVTRDTSRFQLYFPSVNIISPGNG